MIFQPVSGGRSGGEQYEPIESTMYTSVIDGGFTTLSCSEEADACLVFGLALSSSDGVIAGWSVALKRGQSVDRLGRKNDGSPVIEVIFLSDGKTIQFENASGSNGQRVSAVFYRAV